MEYAGLTAPSGLSDGGLPSGCEAQDLPAEVVQVLGTFAFVPLTDRDVEHPVGAEDEVAAVVVAVLGRERSRATARRVGLDVAVADAHQPVQMRDGIRE